MQIIRLPTGNMVYIVKQFRSMAGVKDLDHQVGIWSIWYVRCMNVAKAGKGRVHYTTLPLMRKSPIIIRNSAWDFRANRKFGSGYCMRKLSVWITNSPFLKEETDVACDFLVLSKCSVPSPWVGYFLLYFFVFQHQDLSANHMVHCATSLRLFRS